MSMPSHGGTRPPATFEFSVGETPPRSKWGCVLLIVVVVVSTGMFTMCCGGVIGLVWFGLDAFGEEVAAQLRANPVLMEHLGPIQSFEIDLVASSIIDGDDVFVFNVSGAYGSGIVTCESITTEDGDEYLTWAELKLPDGTTIDIFPEEEDAAGELFGDEEEVPDSF